VGVEALAKDRRRYQNHLPKEGLCRENQLGEMGAIPGSYANRQRKRPYAKTDCALVAERNSLPGKGASIGDQANNGSNEWAW